MLTTINQLISDVNHLMGNLCFLDSKKQRSGIKGGGCFYCLCLLFILNYSSVYIGLVVWFELDCGFNNMNNINTILLRMYGLYVFWPIFFLCFQWKAFRYFEFDDGCGWIFNISVSNRTGANLSSMGYALPQRVIS